MRTVPGGTAGREQPSGRRTTGGTVNPEDVYGQVLGKFCRGLCEKIAALEEEHDPRVVQLVAGGMLDAIREAMANLMLCELECERLVHRA